MTDGSEKFLHESLELAARMLELADRGIAACQDDGCLVVYGIMRDCAYSIRAGAEKELLNHGFVIPPDRQPHVGQES